MNGQPVDNTPKLLNEENEAALRPRSAADAPREPAWRARKRARVFNSPWVWLALACVVFLPCLNFEVGQGNVASDLAAIESLVERHTFYINGSTFADTIDKFRLPDGRFFSQKSPVFHLAAAAVYAPLHAAGFSLRANTRLCLAALTLIFSILPMGLLLWTLARHPWLAEMSWRGRLTLAAAFGLGSLATPFAVTFSHYVAASLFLLLASAALVRAWPGAASPLERDRDRSALFPRAWAWTGFWLSASLACDVPPAFLALVALGAALLIRLAARPARRAESARALLAFWAGAAPLALLYAALNGLILGSPFPPNMHESAMLYYPGSFWSELREQARLGNPGYYAASYWRRLWHAVLGHKGIYWMMPLLAAATAAAVELSRRRGLARRRAAGWPFALAAALFPLLCLVVVMRWAFDLSGGAYNIRHVMAATPALFCVLGHPALLRWRRRAAQWLYAAVAWSVAVAAIGLLNPWPHNTLSAWPPLENAARFCLAHPRSMSVNWIGGLIDATSVQRWNGWLDYGLALEETGDLPAAARALARATQIDPQKPLAYYHLGIAQARAGRPDVALATYTRLQQLEPENLGAWNNAGLFALQTGDAPRAAQCFERSLRLAPDNATGLFGRILLWRMGGRPADAAQELQRALRLHPGDPRLLGLARQN